MSWAARGGVAQPSRVTVSPAPAGDSPKWSSESDGPDPLLSQFPEVEGHERWMHAAASVPWLPGRAMRAVPPSSRRANDAPPPSSHGLRDRPRRVGSGRSAWRTRSPASPLRRARSSVRAPGCIPCPAASSISASLSTAARK